MAAGVVAQVYISIHAPREGGDDYQTVDDGNDTVFQSTPPARGATTLATIINQQIFISIHAPREGGDSKDAQFYLRIFDK